MECVCGEECAYGVCVWGGVCKKNTIGPHLQLHRVPRPTCFISLHQVWALASAAATSSAFPAAPKMATGDVSAASWGLAQGDSLTVSPMLARALASTDTKEVSLMRKACLARWAWGPISSPTFWHWVRAGTKTWSRRSSIPPRRPSSLQSNTPKYSSYTYVSIHHCHTEITTHNAMCFLILHCRKKRLNDANFQKVINCIEM